MTVSWILYPVGVVAAFLCYLLWFQTFSRFSQLVHKIPGPPGYPIIGSILAYFVPQEKLFETIFNLRQSYYPIYKDWTIFKCAVNLQHPDDAEILLTSTEHTNKSALYDLLQSWLGTGLLTSGGAKWHARRKVLTPAFHFNILQEFIKIFNEETEKLVEDLASKSLGVDCIDVVPVVTAFTLTTIAESSMGVKIDTSSKSYKIYKQAVHDFGELMAYRLFRPWLHGDVAFSFSSAGRATKACVKILHDFSRGIVTERSRSFKKLAGGSYASRKRMAMLDLLLSAREEGFDIDDEGIREEVDTFMFEGHDTTAVALCYVFMLLANHSKVQEELHREIIEILGERTPTFNDLKSLAYMDRCLKECLRLYPSVHMISRYASSDLKTATGYLIPEGSIVHLHIFDLHRNPEIYPDPERFDPDRFLPEATKSRHPFAYVPFSAGPRNCIGQKFAMLELKAALCGVLRRFVLEPVDTPETVKFNLDLVLRSQKGIRVRFTPRKQA